jgi:tetratricopeptide (TPR) repeat protein
MRALAGFLVFLAFIAPFLLFGGRHWTALVLLSAAFSAAAAGVAALTAEARFQRGVLVFGAVPVLIGLLQLVPLPHGVVGALSPVRASLQAALPAEDMEGWPDTVGRVLSLAEVLGEGERAEEEVLREPFAYALSFDPAGTRLAVVALLAAVLLLASLAGQRDPSLGLGVLAACLVSIALGASYGLWHARAGGPLYGLFEPPPFDIHRPYGTFWNLNHFAGLCALSCPVLLAAALDAGRKWPTRIAGLLLLAPCAAAVLDAGSRGGLLAGGTGALLLGLLLVRPPGRKPLGLGIVGGSAVAVVLAFTVFSEQLIDESFDETTALEHASNRQRIELYQRQLRMIGSAPLAGHGLGAFHDAHGPYTESAAALVPHHGESDWIEVAVESGVLAWLAWGGLILMLFYPAVKAALSGRAPPLLSGLLAGSLATLAHAAVDYQHREPAVAVVSLLLAGTARAWARSLDEGGPEQGRNLRRSVTTRILAVACLLVGVFAMASVRPALRFDQGRDRALRAFEAAEPGLALVAAIGARTAKPGDGQGWALEAAAHEQLAPRTRGDGRREHRKAALAASAQALRCSPATLGAARRAGSLLLAVGATDEARRAAELAVLVAPGHSPSRQLLGEVLLVEERDGEALEQLAFAYEGIPLARLATQAPQFGRLLDEACHGDPATFLEAVKSAEHRAWHLSALARSGRAGDLPAYFTLLKDEPLPARARTFVGLLVQAPGPEAASFARHLLPALDDAWGRTLAARALVEGGAPDEGARVLEEVIQLEDAPPDAWLALADAKARQGDAAAAGRLLQEGLAQHPDHAGLRTRLKAHAGR